MPVEFKNDMLLTELEFWTLVAKYVIFPRYSTCWIWTGLLSHDGYARITLWRNGKHVHRYTHREIYRLRKKFKDDSKGLDHTCRNRACVRPSHVVEATNRENLLAPGSLSLAKKNHVKTHCAHGHEYTQENTYLRPKGGRGCRECMRIKDRKRGPKRRAQYAMRKLQDQDRN
jgi:hypothetical protein